MPAFVVMQDNADAVSSMAREIGAPGFMPALYQGDAHREWFGADSVSEHVPDGLSRVASSARKLDFLNQAQRRARRVAAPRTDRTRGAHRQLRTRLPHAGPRRPRRWTCAKETEEPPRQLYGMDQHETAKFGRTCACSPGALVERGVRFVQLYHGSGSKWDAHAGIEKNHAGLCRSMDQPVAGLLADLKRRGLLDQTLVVWGGEFGRTPMSEKGDGRDHNPTGFTMWMAGGGVKGGQVIGETDELGLRAVRDRLHVHDLHATILSLLGVDHMKLVYKHKGRPERPTLNEGEAFRKIASG